MRLGRWGFKKQRRLTFILENSADVCLFLGQVGPSKGGIASRPTHTNAR